MGQLSEKNDKLTNPKVQFFLNKQIIFCISSTGRKEGSTGRKRRANGGGREDPMGGREGPMGGREGPRVS